MFRREHLAPALRNHAHVRVVFDGLDGVSASFLEEAFGGLIQEEGMTRELLDTRLTLSTTERSLADDVALARRCIEDAAEAARRG